MTQSLPIRPTAHGDRAPVSFAQQRLWFLHQLSPGNPFYNVPAAIRLDGRLNLDALEQSFNQIVQRHEALRTNFTKVDGQPVQVIASSLNVSIPIVDLRSVPETQREALTQHLINEAAQQPFDLSTDALLRVKVLKLQETEHVLLLTLHHIVADGWSLGVLIRELSTLYAALVQGELAVLPDLPIQYADFAHWQRQWLQGDVLQTQLAYWRQQLQGTAPLNLPRDRPRPPVQTYRGATEPIQLSPQLTIGLESLSHQSGVSLFMTLLAAFQTLLYRYTGQTDIAIGAPIANRHRRELEDLIGFFVNSLVLRSDLSGNPTVRSLLRRVQEAALGAYAHQDLPFEKLVEKLDPERDLSRNPLFQVGFALQNAPMQQLQLPDLTLRPMHLNPGTTRFDLEVHLWEPEHGLSRLWQSQDEGLSGFIAYSTDLFDRATIARMIRQFQTLLEGMVANPDARLADLPLLTPAEQQQLWVEWNQTQTDDDRTACFHHLVEAQAQDSPDAIAVVSETECLTYQSLNQRANQLAHVLQQQGICPDRFVGVYLDRGPELVVAILGILKAGGVYLPLDPTYPRDRLRFMLEDTQVSLVLTQSHLMEQLPPSQAAILCLDCLDDPKNHQSQEALHSTVTADHLAYIIYTSGSTGTPKGVLISHRGLCNVVYAQQQVFDLSSESRVLQFSSPSFDASIFEIAMALGSGGSLHIPAPSARLPGSAFTQFLHDRAITHAILPPAVLSLLPADNLPDLQTVISGGEACSQDIVDRWAVDRSFFNAYGPTETAIWATVAQLHPGSKLTIGRPVANTQIYILDAHLQSVPIGIPGELYIGGDGVARGYWNRPDLTTERFIANPFPAASPSLLPSPRLYKTGDRARYLPDGTIEFLGRLDDQIKIRGFRIELGEIAAVLRQHSAIQEAVVVADSVSSKDSRLIAYFTLRPLERQAALPEQALQTQQIDYWQTLYNQTYAQSDEGDPTFNRIGWNSSYTGQPIPLEQMQEWVHDRVQQIRALQPQRVLEIGCGTGLLLFQLAPHCSEYWGTDFSAASLSYIQRQAERQNLPQVTLRHQMAADFEGIGAAMFDVVILNSVVQYFPNQNYLLTVLEQAVQAVAPGGVIFIGDVRSLPLLSAFHASVQLHQAEDSLERSQLRQRVERSRFEEPELVVDPAFFEALRDRIPSICQVQVQLTRGRHLNEMTQFRYNVLLHIQPLQPETMESASTSNSVEWIDWTQTQPTITPLGNSEAIATIRDYLLNHQPDALSIANVPNARVIAAVKTAEWIESAEAPKTVARFRETLESQCQGAIDPQDWWELETLPYTVDITWSTDTAEGRYDVEFVRHGVEANRVTWSTQRREVDRLWSSYTNQPLQAQAARQLIPSLRSHLEQKLPDYMIPAAFVGLESLPLTPAGKVDRRALPAPDALPLQANVSDAAPRSPTEEILSTIWKDLLRLTSISIHANFFELGGHSLLATQMASRVRDAFKLELPLQNVFEAPTIAQLATVIETLQTSKSETTVPAIVKLDRAAHRRSRSTLASQHPGRQA